MVNGKAHGMADLTAMYRTATSGLTNERSSSGNLEKRRRELRQLHEQMTDEQFFQAYCPGSKPTAAWPRLWPSTVTPERLKAYRQKWSEAQAIEINNLESDTASRLAQPKKCRCGGTGWIASDYAVGHPDFGKVIACICAEDKASRKARLTAASGLPEKLEGTPATFTSFDNRRQPDALAVNKRVYEWANGAGKPIVLLGGDPGTGKTHLVVAAGWTLIGRGEQVRFITVADLSDALRSVVSADRRDDPSFEAVLTAFVDMPNLILDDLGREHTTEWWNATFYRLLNARVVAGSRTAITTNLDLTELRERYGDPIFSRLTSGFWALLTGKDMRSRA